MRAACGSCGVRAAVCILVVLTLRGARQVVLADAHISSMHLVVEGTESDGRMGAWLHDKSTNGVFLNGKRIGKGNRELARSGDLVSFVVVPHAAADGTYSYVNDPNLVRASDSNHPVARADWPASRHAE